MQELEQALAKITKKRQWARAILLRLSFDDGRALTLREVGNRLGREDDPLTPIIPGCARQLTSVGIGKLFQSRKRRSLSKSYEGSKLKIS